MFVMPRVSHADLLGVYCYTFRFAACVAQVILCASHIAGRSINIGLSVRSTLRNFSYR